MLALSGPASGAAGEADDDYGCCSSASGQRTTTFKAVCVLRNHVLARGSDEKEQEVDPRGAALREML
jgi:hypothetical protein